ncbi:unnamed protein product, partial [Prunus brigantina]
MISGGTPIADSSLRSVKSYVRAIRHPQVLSLTEEPTTKFGDSDENPSPFLKKKRRASSSPIRCHDYSSRQYRFRRRLNPHRHRNFGQRTLCQCFQRPRNRPSNHSSRHCRFRIQCHHRQARPHPNEGHFVTTYATAQIPYTLRNRSGPRGPIECSDMLRVIHGGISNPGVRAKDARNTGRYLPKHAERQR